jgi:hypothetical protein
VLNSKARSRAHIVGRANHRAQRWAFIPDDIPLYTILMYVAPFAMAKNEVKLKIIPYKKDLLANTFFSFAPMLLRTSGSFYFFCK